MSNHVDYFEIGAADPQAAREFWGGLFGWQVGPAEPAYAMVETDKGGLWDTGDMGGQNWAIFYVHVDDVEKSVARAQELGASVAVPMIDNGRIQFAHLVDPAGNRFGVWHPHEGNEQP
jgi:predicted enzyme related to lactoylglutathione lyase